MKIAQVFLTLFLISIAHQSPDDFFTQHFAKRCEGLAKYARTEFPLNDRSPMSDFLRPIKCIRWQFLLWIQWFGTNHMFRLDSDVNNKISTGTEKYIAESRGLLKGFFQQCLDPLVTLNGIPLNIGPCSYSTKHISLTLTNSEIKLGTKVEETEKDVFKKVEYNKQVCRAIADYYNAILAKHVYRSLQRKIYNKVGQLEMQSVRKLAKVPLALTRAVGKKTPFQQQYPLNLVLIIPRMKNSILKGEEEPYEDPLKDMPEPKKGYPNHSDEIEVEEDTPEVLNPEDEETDYPNTIDDMDTAQSVQPSLSPVEVQRFHQLTKDNSEEAGEWVPLLPVATRVKMLEKKQISFQPLPNGKTPYPRRESN